jgi:hypothetical protein
MSTNIMFVIFLVVAAIYVGSTMAADDGFKCLGASSKCFKVNIEREGAEWEINSFQIVTGGLDQQKGEESCHEMGGSLASIHSTEENNFLLGQFIN